MDRNEFINRLFETARRKAGNAPDFACEACYGNSESFEVQVKNGEIYQYNVRGRRPGLPCAGQWQDGLRLHPDPG